jgi:predicted Rossmann-fold nucleotide-binding protein
VGWALAQKMRGPRPPLVLIGPRWVRAIDALADILAIAPADLALLTLVDTPEEALAAVEAGRRVT